MCKAFFQIFLTCCAITTYGGSRPGPGGNEKTPNPFGLRALRNARLVVHSFMERVKLLPCDALAPRVTSTLGLAPIARRPERIEPSLALGCALTQKAVAEPPRARREDDIGVNGSGCGVGWCIHR